MSEIRRVKLRDEEDGILEVIDNKGSPFGDYGVSMTTHEDNELADEITLAVKESELKKFHKQLGELLYGPDAVVIVSDDGK